MAQKKALAAKSKKAANGVEKKVVKRGAKVLEEREEIVVAQSPSKKSRKQPVKEVPQSSEEESEVEEQNGDQAEDDSDSAAEEGSDLIDDEAEEDEEDSDEEDDETDEVEPGEVSKCDTAAEGDDSDDDDEAPIEEPLDKKGKKNKQPENSEDSEKKTGIPKVRVGRIPPETPKNQIIYVSNLPKEYKHKDIIALFSKFGAISILNRFTSKNGANSALIAFETPAGPEAVMEAKPKALTFENHVLTVSRPRDKVSLNDRTVVVGLIGPKITTEDLKTYFEKVAPVEMVTISPNRFNPKAFVLLASADDVPKALKLHSTELFSRYITVRPVSPSAKERSSNNTIVVDNLGKHESYSAEALEKIFKKFGEVDEVDVVCSKTVLAFVSFKLSEAAAKALDQLQGKTVNKLELKLHRFERATSTRAILVTNLSSGTTEADLREVFSESGDIESIQMMGIKAVVKFANDDSFCKSFLENERIVNNAPIFIEPNSLLKYKLSKKRAAGAHANAPAKFEKNTKNFGNKPFNKRPSQENGRRPFAKRAKF